MSVLLVKAEVSEKIRLNARPYIVLRTNGSSYVNKKLASLLDLKPGDVLAFYSTEDKKSWYLVNDKSSGAAVDKKDSLYKFCDVIRAREIFAAYHVEAGKVKAFFPVADKLEESNGIKSLYIIPKPFNVG